MAEALSPADRASLAAEQGPVNMTIGAVVLLERSPGLAYEAICRRIEERIHLMPRYRQRLREPQLSGRSVSGEERECFT